MIRQHAFNTRWWGREVGIVTDARFFELAQSKREELLSPYEWVEFKAPLEQAPPGSNLAQAGFFWADVQIEFRIGLSQVASSPSSGALQVEFADEVPFSVQAIELRPFEHERFFALPGVTTSRINDRIVLWSQEIIAQNAAWCLRVLSGGAVQGWFLSAPSERGLHLAIAMLHRDAAVTGLHLYQRAMQSYAQRGARIGWAGFSVKNGPVHNIYAKLGAHFTATTGCWLWVKSAILAGG